MERTELMSDLDRLLCGPLYGYDDVEKYWEEASCIRRLGEHPLPFRVHTSTSPIPFSRFISALTPPPRVRLPLPALPYRRHLII